MAVSGRYGKGKSIMSLLEQKNPRRTEVQAGKFVQGNRQALESGRWRMHFPSQTQQCRGQWSGLFNKKKLIILLKASTFHYHLYAPPPNLSSPRDYRAIHTVMPLIVTTCFKQSHHWIFSDMNLPAYLCFFTTINMTNLQKQPKEESNYYFIQLKISLHNKYVQLALRHCCKASWIAMLRVLAPTKTNLSCNRSGCWKLRKGFPESREKFYFGAKSVHIGPFSEYGLDGINLPRLKLTAPLWLHVWC